MMSASSFPRARACPASAALPHSSVSSAAASLGTALHAYLADALELGRDAALTRVPHAYLDACAAVDLDAALPQGPGRYLAEVAYEYDVADDSARMLGQHLGRAYPRAEKDRPVVHGTADVVGLTDGAVHVLDYKTGQQDGTPPAQENLQLHTYALLAARAHGVERATVSLVFIEGSHVHTDTAELDALHIEAVAASLRETLAEVEKAKASLERGQASTREGPHCRYCPAFATCPAKVALSSSLACADGFLPTVLDAKTAPKVLDRLEAAEEVLARVRRTLEEYAQEAPIECPDGTVYGPVSVTRESLDGDAGYPVLAARYGDEVAQAAVETKHVLTKVSLARALGDYARHHPGQSLSRLESSALQSLRAHGAARAKTTTCVKRHVVTREKK